MKRCVFAFDVILKIDVIASNKNILPYVHLPIQSGSDRILKLMGRKYNRESYLNLVSKLRKIPNLCLTTDIIVGFPGETVEDIDDIMVSALEGGVNYWCQEAEVIEVDRMRKQTRLTSALKRSSRALR